MTPYQEYIHASRYARFDDALGRREFWPETIGRYFDYFERDLDERHSYKLSALMRSELESAVLNMDVMPSMRALMTAGDALRRDNIAGYNCAYLPIDRPRAFAEVLYILMCGTGVGFSVERQEIAKLPEIAATFSEQPYTIVVGDSKMGWADAFEQLIDRLYAGRIPKIDYSQVRPAGERLKTFGGRASGPEPLRQLFEFTIRLFRNASGRKLNSLEVHEVCTKAGDVVVVGGVRRSAEISLSNLSDLRMRNAKSGNWYDEKPHLALANNSVAYTEKPDVSAWFDEWSSLYHSRSGERGIFNRHGAVQKTLRLGRRDHSYDFGTNPCGEIILRPRGLCNLTEAVVRETDGINDIREKVRLASILGTWQSTQTSFQFVEPEWQINANEERLLGVSLTGIYDNVIMRGGDGSVDLPSSLVSLKQSVIRENRMTAKAIGINPSVAVTTVKPSGTVSQLVQCSSGIHQVQSKRYLRRTASDKKDPLTQFLIDAGIPYAPHWKNPDQMVVFSWPTKAADAAIVRNDVTAIQHLELVKTYNSYWSEHAVSCTVSVREHEWPRVGGWVYDNFDNLTGVSFLPHFAGDTTYPEDMIPELEVSEDRYQAELAKMPASIDWAGLAKFERDGEGVSATREFACVGNMCEIIGTAI